MNPNVHLKREANKASGIYRYGTRWDSRTQVTSRPGRKKKGKTQLLSELIRIVIGRLQICDSEVRLDPSALSFSSPLQYKDGLGIIVEIIVSHYFGGYICTYDLQRSVLPMLQ